MSNSLSPCTRSMYIRSFKATTMGVSLAHLINLCSCFLVDQSSLCPSWNQHESRFAVRHQNHQHEAASRLAQEDGQAILVADMIQCPDQKPSHPLRWKKQRRNEVGGGQTSEVWHFEEVQTTSKRCCFGKTAVQFIPFIPPRF